MGETSVVLILRLHASQHLSVSSIDRESINLKSSAKEEVRELILIPLVQAHILKENLESYTLFFPFSPRFTRSPFFNVLRG